MPSRPAPFLPPPSGEAHADDDLFAGWLDTQGLPTLRFKCWFPAFALCGLLILAAVTLPLCVLLGIPEVDATSLAATEDRMLLDFPLISLAYYAALGLLSWLAARRNYGQDGTDGGDV